MRCVQVLVLLLIINICRAQQAADPEEPAQQVSTRRRRVTDLADVDGEAGDVATPDEDRLPTPNRPRNPNRRRRKRKRIPPPRPQFEDYVDTIAFPTPGDRLGENSRGPGDDEATGPEHRALPPSPRRRLRDDDDERPLRRERPRPRGEGFPLDREGQPSAQRPFREPPYEEGEHRPQRPLRRRRKNRRRPPLGPPDGVREDPLENGEFPPHRDVPQDTPRNREEDLEAEDHVRVPPSERHPPDADTPNEDELRGRNRPIEDIPLGSLRGEVRPRQRIRTGGETEPEHEATDGEDGSTARRPQTTTPESLPAENLPSNNYDNLPPRQRRRRIRPRTNNQSSTEKAGFLVKDEQKPLPQHLPKEVDMLVEREPLKLREETGVLHEPEEKKEPLPSEITKKADEKDLNTKDGSIISGDITLETTPIKISLSDLLREKNISIEEILKDDEPDPPPPRYQRPYKPRPPPPTPKTIVKPTLTQLSRVHQFLNNPLQEKHREKNSHTKSESSGQTLNTEKTTSTTQKSYTQTSTARTNTPTSTQRKSTTATQTTPRFQTSTTSRITSTSTARVGTTRRTEKETTEKTARPTGFSSRAPVLNMQETEDIDPVKMTGKSPARPGNSKAAEFLKSRVRLPPSSVLFPKANGRGGEQSPTAPDQEPLPTRVVNNVQHPNSAGNTSKGTKSVPVATSNTESNKIGPVIQSDAVLTNSNVPVYVLNPKYYKASQPPRPETKPSDSISPTETNNIPKTEKSNLEQVQVLGETTQTTVSTSTSTTESFSDSQMSTDADPLRLNIPLKSGTDDDQTEKESNHGKSAEDEIVELLETENGSDRLSRILASRNMTLTELIEHRERGASQQHISDIFLRNEETKVVPNVYTEEPKKEGPGPLNVKIVPKIEELFNGQYTPAKKMNVEIVEDEDEDDEENSKRVPRVFEGLVPFKPKPELVPELEYKDSYPQSSMGIGSDYAIETYRPHRKHENPGKVREIVTKVSDDNDEFVGLPSGMKSAILASSAVLGLTIFVFLAIFVTCKVRKRQSIRKRYANRSPILNHDVEKSRSMTPVLRHSGYKDMTEERRYYLWNTIRKTLRYK